MFDYRDTLIVVKEPFNDFWNSIDIETSIGVAQGWWCG
jgi:hypothetical protein